MRLHKATWYETEKYWPAISEWLDRALKHGRFAYSNEDMFWLVAYRKATLWVGLDEDRVRGFAITSIEQMPRARYLTILVMGGHAFKDWEHLLPGLEEEAVRLNCDQICAIGRKGWERMAAESGMKPYAVVYRKEITDEHRRRSRRINLETDGRGVIKPSPGSVVTPTAILTEGLQGSVGPVRPGSVQGLRGADDSGSVSGNTAGPGYGHFRGDGVNASKQYH